ncbi:S8 family serine peptidase [Kytococcus sedentarius]
MPRPMPTALDGAGQSRVATLSREGSLRDVRPMVDAPASSLRSLKTTAESRSGEAQADMSLWMVAEVPEGEMDRVLRELAADPAVEAAMPQPLPVAPPSAGAPADPFVRAGSARSAADEPGHLLASPDFSDRQTYRGPASEHGIEALAAHELPGGKGSNVAVADVEFGWTMDHEDVTQLAREDALIANGTPVFDYADHGTAVMGEIVGDENGSGVSGIAPEATAYVANAVSSEAGYTPGAGIAVAAEKLEAGDVILLEQQLQGCGGDMAPVEIDPAAHDAIRAATAKGIHVVEAAGNGAQNLDDPCYGGEGFPGGRGDSGAILVGAAASSRSGYTPGRRLGFSTYGSPVDVHGWGESVATAGYGDLQGGDATVHYTDQFSGTSSASPIVAGAVAQIASVAEERGVELDPAAMRDLLVETGSARACARGCSPSGPCTVRVWSAPSSAVRKRSDCSRRAAAGSSTNQSSRSVRVVGRVPSSVSTAARCTEAVTWATRSLTRHPARLDMRRWSPGESRSAVWVRSSRASMATERTSSLMRPP